jgi:hypothetical protein
MQHYLCTPLHSLHHLCFVCRRLYGTGVERLLCTVSKITRVRTAQQGQGGWIGNGCMQAMPNCVDHVESHARQGTAVHAAAADPTHPCADTSTQVGTAKLIPSVWCAASPVPYFCMRWRCTGSNVNKVGSTTAALSKAGLLVTIARVIAGHSITVYAAAADPTHPCIHHHTSAHSLHQPCLVCRVRDTAGVKFRLCAVLHKRLNRQRD